MSSVPSAGGAFLPGQSLLSSSSATTGPINPTSVASQTNVSAVATSTTLSEASYAPSVHTDQYFSAITLTPDSGTVTAVNGLNAIRGEMKLSSGMTLSGTSFVTSVYGRGNINGTVNIGSGDLAAVYGKFDLNGSTLTSGHIAPVQSNIVNPPATANDVGVALFYGESASGTPIGTGIELYMAADYFMTLTQVSGGSFFGASAPTSLAKSLKIKVGGTDYYIGLYSAAS